MTTRGNWILMLATLAAAAWGFTGCAHGPTPAVETETVGNLSASYHSIAVAPVHHDAPPQFGFVAGSDDDDVSSVATTVTRAGDAGSDDAAPEVVAKTGGLVTGEVR